MLLRKMNAGCSLLSAILLLAHALFFSIGILSGGSIAETGNYLSWILMGFTMIHALISIDFLISGHTDNETHKGKHYPKKNISMIIQRLSGALMMLFVGLHIAGAKNYFQAKMFHGVIHPLFFAVVLVHVAVSTSKAFITLGIGNVKTVKIVDIVIKILCAVTLIAGVTSFYLYLFTEAAK